MSEKDKKMEKKSSKYYMLIPGGILNRPVTETLERADRRARALEKQMKNREQGNIFIIEGRNCRVSYAGIEFIHKNLLGFELIRNLLREPFTELSSNNLESLVYKADPADLEVTKANKKLLLESDLVSGDKFATGIEMSNRKAVKGYRARLKQIIVELDIADSVGDIERVECLKKEKDLLYHELKIIHNIHGDIKKTLSEVDKTRLRMYQIYQYCLTVIKSYNEDLYEHLKVSIKTGSFFSYSPQNPTDWTTE